jgi:hypothetical protein
MSFLTLAAFTAASLALAADTPEPAKKQKLEVSFSVPSSAEKASITEARIVGKELWVRVDIKGAGGIGLAVISKAKDEVTIEAPALPVKYVVFGKTWGWKNEEKGITFLKDLDDKDREKAEKAFEGGKSVWKRK